MDEKFQAELEHSCGEEENARDDQEFYETIEAPKFVDFTRPNHFCPDDRYWFCSRLGCNQKHEEELDSETIYKNFVLRVMAARSPNVRFQRALNRKPSDVKKCPMTAPPKSSKSRIPRLALVSSVSRKLMVDGKDGTVKPEPIKPIAKSKTARVKHVPAKYMTSPRKKKGGSPKLDGFRSVRNPKKTSITMQKSKVVAKALLFSSPKKLVKAKASEIATATATPLTRLCEGVTKLAITSEKMGVAQKPIARKILPFDASRKPGSVAQKVRTRKEHIAESSRDVKVKTAKPVKKPVKFDEKTDGILRNTDSGSEKEPTSSSERPLTAESSDGLFSINLTSESNSDPESGNQCSEQQNKMDRNKENESSAKDDLENRDPGVIVELVDSDDKENSLNTDNIRNVNRNILGASAKPKVKTFQKTRNEDKKLTKENRPAAITQGVKYKKLKPTNPKPFRLRTDERGILKEAISERKVNSHENSTTTSENSQAIENTEKKIDDKTHKKAMDKTKNKSKSKEITAVPDRRTTPALHKQHVLPQREIGSAVKRRRPEVTEKTTTIVPKPMGSRQQRLAAKKASVPRESRFHMLNKPTSCTRNIL